MKKTLLNVAISLILVGIIVIFVPSNKGTKLHFDYPENIYFGIFIIFIGIILIFIKFFKKN